MTAAGTLENRVRVLRPKGAEEARTPMGSVDPALKDTGRLWVALRDPQTRQTDPGAGEEIAGSMEVQAHYPADIRFRDVLDVVAGPHAGQRWRVVSQPHKDRRDGLTATVEPYLAEVSA